MSDINSADKFYFSIINQIFEIEKKVNMLNESNTIQRNINKLKSIFETEIPTLDKEPAGYIYYNPISEKYDETRNDCEASIAGTTTNNLEITEVIKPIIRFKKGPITQIVQKAVVVVQSKNK